VNIHPAMRLAIDALATEGLHPNHIRDLRASGVFPPTETSPAIIVPWDSNVRAWKNEETKRVSDETWYLLRDVIEQFKPCGPLFDPYVDGNIFVFGTRRLFCRRPLTRTEVLACCTGPVMPREFQAVAKRKP